MGILVHKNQLVLECPFHEDRHPSASINVEQGVWICYTGCGSGSLKTFLQKYLGKSPLQLDVMLREFEVQVDSKIWVDKDDKDVSVANPLSEVKFPFKQGVVPKWIFNRGFTAQTLLKWECGTSDDGALAIPIKDEFARTVGWVTRSAPGGGKRYLYSSGLKTSRILFGRYNIQSEKNVCLTEGTLDTMWLDQNGFASVALLGIHLSQYQELLLSKLTIGELILCLDNDEAGRTATKAISDRLSKHFPVSFISLPKQYKDVQDVRNSQELKDIIGNRSIMQEA